MTIVLVHGSPETEAVWDDLVPHLRGDDVVRLSPPGFGSVIPFGFDCSTDAYRDWLADELGKLAQPIDLVGHDWGGGHVIRIAMERSGLIRSWTSDILGCFDPDYVWHEMAQAWQTADVGEQAVAQMLSLPAEVRAQRYESLGMTSAIAQKVAAGANRELGRAILAVYRSAAQPVMRDLGAGLPRAAAKPGLALIAMEDSYCGGETLARRSAERAGAKVAVLEGAGHWWMCQHPRQGAEAINEFLARLAQTAFSVRPTSRRDEQPSSQVDLIASGDCSPGEGPMRHAEPDVVIVGAGIAGGALGTVLARAGFEVALLERETSYPDRVRGEFMAPWGVTELAKLELLQPLREAGALFTRRNIPYDENFDPAEAEARAFDLTKMHSEGLGGLCLGHPTTCAIFVQLATAAGATLLRGAGDISVTPGSRPLVSCTHDGATVELRPKLVIGSDGRNSSVRKDLGFKVNADEPRNLLGGMLVKGVPSWPRDMQVIGVEGRFHFLVFPQGDDLLRLYGSYQFADKSRFDGPTRRAKLIDAFGKLSCLPYAEAISVSTPIGPFNSFSNEDHWIDDPICPGIVLVGDAAGHNDPIIGQGLSIALRDVRLVSEILRDARTAGREPDFRPYVEERAERMRRLRITAQVVTTLRVEFGPEARERRARVGKRVAAGQLAPLPASLIGPERLPAEAFLPETIDRLLAS